MKKSQLRSSLRQYGKREVFPAFAIFLFVLDVILYVANQGPRAIPLTSFFVELLVCAAIAMLPGKPTSMSYIALGGLFLLLADPGQLFAGGLVSALSILLISDQISRGSNIRAFAFFMALGIARVLSGSSVASVVLAVTVEGLLSLSIGLLMYHLVQKNFWAEQEISKQKDRIRLELAFALHDSVATELTKALLALRQTTESGVDGRVEYELHFVERHLQSGLEKVRGITSTMSDLADNEAVSLEELLRAEKTSLERSHRVFRLNGVIPPDLHQRLGDLKYHLVISFVREALMNCLKYAPRNSQVDCEICAGKTHFEVLVFSDLADQTQVLESVATSSRLGIEGLQHRASALGASVEAGELEGRWIISLAVPLIVDHEIFSVGEYSD